MERDYILTWLLKGFYSEKYPMHKHLAFKGGTALHKAYFPGSWRFSEDLDFSLCGVKPEQLGGATEILTGRKDLSFEQYLEDVVFRDLTDLSQINFSLDDYRENPGMIYSDIQYSWEGFRGRVKFDLSLAEGLLFDLETREITSPYKEIGPFPALCYSLKEIVIEKVAALIDRGKARDYYDVWRLLRENDFNLFELRPYIAKKVKANFTVNVLAASKLKAAASNWDSKVAYLVRGQILPDFNAVAEEIQQYLEAMELITRIDAGNYAGNHIATLRRIEMKNLKPVLPVFEVLDSILSQPNPHSAMFALNSLHTLAFSQSEAKKVVKEICSKKVVDLANDPDAQVASAANELLKVIL